MNRCATYPAAHRWRIHASDPLQVEDPGHVLGFVPVFISECTYGERDTDGRSTFLPARRLLGMGLPELAGKRPAVDAEEPGGEAPISLDALQDA